jgi:hypothetical protein
VFVVVPQILNLANFVLEGLEVEFISWCYFGLGGSCWLIVIRFCYFGEGVIAVVEGLDSRL